MSCGKPVLMMIDGISRELIEVTEAGLYSEPENRLDFKSKVMKYANDQNLMYKHGQNGYAYVRENFDREKLAKLYLEHVHKIL